MRKLFAQKAWFAQKKTQLGNSWVQEKNAV
jgi:hypothetical protein